MSYLSDKDYNFIYSKSTRFCVDILLVKSGSVFLIKRDLEPYKGKLHFPGGRVRFRETIYDAIQRIAKTEIGVEVINTPKMIGWMEFLKEKQNGLKRHSISIVFKCNIKSKELHNGVWVKELSKKIHPIHRKFLKSNRVIF